jgi:hypothetical protein
MKEKILTGRAHARPAHEPLSRALTPIPARTGHEGTTAGPALLGSLCQGGQPR